MKVLVVGAGPTGLSAALEMRRLGIEAHVVDKRDEASGWSRAVGILPRSLELLEPSGASQALMDQGIMYEGVHIHRGSKELAHFSFSKVDKDRSILGLAQNRTETILHDCLIAAGGSLRYSKELVGYEDDGVQVRAKFADGDAETYDYLLGADGVLSTVREIAGLAYPGMELPEQWSIADVETENWTNSDAFSVYLLPKGIVCVVAPMEQNRMRIIANRPDALSVLPVPIDVSNIRCEGNFTISVRQVDEYRKGRVFLAGDAAHCHSPVGGRGMNLGIDDACSFANRLKTGALDGYSAERHAVGKEVIALSEGGRKVLAMDAPFKRGFAMMALSIAGHVPFLERAFLRRTLNI